MTARPHWLGDGFHRLLAHQEAHGSTVEIAAMVKAGTRRDAVLAAAGANAAHGLRRSAADKARAVDALLTDDEWGLWSDREIGRRCNVSHPFVAKRRALLPESEETSERNYVTGHGTTATMRTAGITSANRERADLTGNVSSQDAGNDAGPVKAWGAARGSPRDQALMPQTPVNDVGRQNGPNDADDESAMAHSSPEVQALPADLLALGWQINELPSGGRFYGYRPRHGNQPARATDTVAEIEEVAAAIRTVENARRGDERVVDDEQENHSSGEDPLVTVMAPASTWMVLQRYLRSWQAATVDEEQAKLTIVQAIDGAVAKVVD